MDTEIGNNQAAIDDVMAEYFPDEQPTNESPKVSTNGSGGALENRAQHYIGKIEPASEGFRNHRAFNAAGHLAAMVDDAGARLGEDAIVGLVQQLNAGNSPPLPEAEIRSVVRSAMRNGTPRPDKQPTMPERGARLTGDANATHVSDSEPVSFASLLSEYPKLRPPVIDGLLRQGETLNVIGASKAGKSWLTYLILLCIKTGRSLFDAFPCAAGRVLLIDNELHGPTIANRIPKVAEAMGIQPHEYAEGLDVLSLRGQGVTLPALAQIIDRIEAGYYKAIICDAWYRFIPSGMNENSNADVMSLYNMLDRYAAQTQAAWIVVHHSSKGSQGEKSVTDVGAGAGAQSRAADAHLILRDHEEDDAVVLEAAVRSFPPVEPIGLR